MTNLVLNSAETQCNKFENLKADEATDPGINFYNEKLQELDSEYYSVEEISKLLEKLFERFYSACKIILFLQLFDPRIFCLIIFLLGTTLFLSLIRYSISSSTIFQFICTDNLLVDQSHLVSMYPIVSLCFGGLLLS